MYRFFSFLLVVAGIILAVLGITTYQDATAGVSFLGLDLSLSDQEAKQKAVMYLGGAAVCLLAAFALFRKS